MHPASKQAPSLYVHHQTEVQVKLDVESSSGRKLVCLRALACRLELVHRIVLWRGDRLVTALHFAFLHFAFLHCAFLHLAFLHCAPPTWLFSTVLFSTLFFFHFAFSTVLHCVFSTVPCFTAMCLELVHRNVLWGGDKHLSLHWISLQLQIVALIVLHFFLRCIAFFIRCIAFFIRCIASVLCTIAYFLCCIAFFPVSLHFSSVALQFSLLYCIFLRCIVVFLRSISFVLRRISFFRCNAYFSLLHCIFFRFIAFFLALYLFYSICILQTTNRLTIQCRLLQYYCWLHTFIVPFALVCSQCICQYVGL